jgi:hypothetical protein
MAKLTKRTADALQPRAKLYISFDSDIPGFGVRVMPSGVKTFILEYRPMVAGAACPRSALPSDATVS